MTSADEFFESIEVLQLRRAGEWFIWVVSIVTADVAGGAVVLVRLFADDVDRRRGGCVLTPRLRRATGQ